MTSKGNPSLSFDIAKEYVDRKNVPDAFVALESMSGAEVADVLDRARIENKVIIAMDAAQSTLEWIEKGKLRQPSRRSRTRWAITG